MGLFGTNKRDKDQETSNKYKRDNEAVYQRFQRSERANNTTEMYAAKGEHDENVEAQKKQLANMEKGSPEYEKLRGEISEQQDRARDMSRRCAAKLDYDEHPKKLESLKYENKKLEREMHEAIDKGDTKAYDAARQKYETNIKAQDSLSKTMNTNGMQHENTTYQQNVAKQNLDNDMADKYREKMQKSYDKGKEPNKQDVEQYHKYMKQTRETEKENLKRIDDMKKDTPKKNNYGLDDNDIEEHKTHDYHQYEHTR